MSTVAHSATIADPEAYFGRCELINGEIIAMAPTSYEHGNAANLVGYVVTQWAQGQPYRVLTCDPGFIWDKQTVRAPDVAIITASQAQAAPRCGFMPFAPLLAVEVVAPGDAWAEVQEKASGWIQHGVQMVWIVEPKGRTVDMWLPGERVRGDDVLDGGTVLPGFSCSVTNFFR